MKNRSFLFGFTILCCTSIIAQQEYIPVAQSGKFWYYEVYEELEYNSYGEKILDRIIYCGEDTLVGGLRYHKLYNFTETPIELEDLENHLIALIRDDSIGQKTYLLPLDTMFLFCELSEHIIFDFNPDLDFNCMDSCIIKRIGYFRSGLDNYPGCVMAIEESIVDWWFVPLEGIRTSIILSASYFYEYDLFAQEWLLEGVGYANYHNGFFYDHFSRLVGYCEGTLEECGLIVSTSEIDKQAVRISILPNPVYDYLRVEASVDFTWISIMDMYGKEVYRINQSEVDLSHLHPGLYILRVHSKGREYVQKFVKM